MNPPAGRSGKFCTRLCGSEVLPHPGWEEPGCGSGLCRGFLTSVDVSATEPRPRGCIKTGSRYKMPISRLMWFGGWIWGTNRNPIRIKHKGDGEVLTYTGIAAGGPTLVPYTGQSWPQSLQVALGRGSSLGGPSRFFPMVS